MKDNKTAPDAMTPTAVLDSRFPTRPLMTNPIAGKSGMSQIRSKKFIRSSPLHQIDLVDVHRLFVLEHRDHDPETDRRFRRSHCDNKNSEDLTRYLLQSVGESNQIDVYSVHHQLDRHQDDHDIPASQNADDADCE